MQDTVEKLLKQNAEQAALIKELLEQNRILSQKVQFLLKRLFGRKSEALNPAQLEFLLSGLEGGEEKPDPPPPPQPTSRREHAPREHKPRMPEHLPVEEIVIDPQAVKRDPEAYECIGQEVTEELDVVPTRYFRRRIIRRKFKSKVNRERAPLIAPLAPRLVEGGYASAGLLTDIVLRKYVDHLPLYRQEQIFRTRHGIELSRKTMTDWVRVVADWLTPIYNHIREELRQSAYLQVDETPVRFCQPEGGSSKGYFWVYNHPGGAVLYEWHTGRGADCLDEMLGQFRGTVQSDGYGAYASYARRRMELVRLHQSDKPIDLAACWAHARRKFHEAREESPALAGWFLHQIGLMYQIERQLKGKGPALRQAARGARTGMVLERIGSALRRKLDKHRPTSTMGKAITYTLSLWPQLLKFRDDGRLEIDNNLVENAVRPTALGKKNWLFIGHPEAGQRSAVIYTLLECCKREGINPQEYLHDVLSRLPAMTNQQTGGLTPANWLAQRRRSQAA